MNAQQLKNAILQEAIQGRLVPQAPNDEPASVLLDKIRAEKKQLVKEGILKKKDLEETPISEDEIPFKLPEKWLWIRINDLGEIITGGTPSKQNKDYYGDDYPFYKPGDLGKGINIDNSVDRLSQKGYEASRKLKAHSVLVTCIGATIGKTGLISKEGACNQQINAIIPVDSLYPKFIYYTICSPSFQSIIRKDAGQTTLPIMNKNNFCKLLFPLPPLAEQKRIVAKIEELLPKVEAYGKAQESLNKLNEELPEKLKKSILQEAIEGRLVPQDPNDEPASVLLDKIRKEKARLVKDGTLKKKDLVETPIEENEIPFKIPKSWEWCRVGTVAEYVNGLAFKPEDWETSGLPIIRIQNLTDYNKPLNYTTKIFDDKFKVENGDLLFSWSATLDSFIWKGQTAWLNQHIFKVNPRVGIFKGYLYYALKAIVSNLSDITHGLTMKHLTRGVFENYSFPLPPLAEQKRIVAKIEEVFKEIDKLKNNG